VFRKIALAHLTSPFVAGCVDSFRDTYARTGMNLIQTMAVLAIAMGRRGWQALSRHRPS
jgi:hypothetical protein